MRVVLWLLVIDLMAVPALANDQCRDLEITHFQQAYGYGPDRYWVTIFNHENYYESAPTGASIAVFFEAQDSENPVVKAGIWPPQPQRTGSYLVHVPNSANHKLTVRMFCYLL